MNPRLRVIAGCAFLLAASASCAEQALVLKPGGAGPTASDTSASSVRPTDRIATATPGTGTTTTVQTTRPAATTSRAVVPSNRDPKEWAPLTVSLNRTCIQRGDELIVTATSTKRAGLGFAVGYSKPPEGADRFVPDYAYFDHESNPTGTLSWSFVVRPTTPLGPGVVKVVANGADGRGAFVSLDIEVSASC